MPKKKNSAVVSLGSNLGEREVLLQQAREMLSTFGTITKTSPITETKAWGKEDQPDFLNQVLLMETPLGAEDFLREMQAIESALGRVRGEKWGPRTIDLDLLFWNTEKINLPNLVVPHPFLKDRQFLLDLVQTIDEKLFEKVHQTRK